MFFDDPVLKSDQSSVGVDEKAAEELVVAEVEGTRGKEKKSKLFALLLALEAAGADGVAGREENQSDCEEGAEAAGAAEAAEVVAAGGGAKKPPPAPGATEEGSAKLKASPPVVLGSRFAWARLESAFRFTWMV